MSFDFSSVNQSNFDKWGANLQTALFYRAMVDRQTSVLERLIDLGYSINTPHPTTGSVMASAIKDNYLETVQLFVRKGFDLNQTYVVRGPQKQAIRPLTHALVESMAEIAQFLIKSGAEVNYQTSIEQHSTPLHLAIYNHMPQIALTLLEYKANPHALNKAGDSAIDYESRTYINNKNPALIKALLSAGVKPTFYSLNESHVRGGKRILFSPVLFHLENDNFVKLTILLKHNNFALLDNSEDRQTFMSSAETPQQREFVQHIISLYETYILSKNIAPAPHRTHKANKI